MGSVVRGTLPGHVAPAVKGAVALAVLPALANLGFALLVPPVRVEVDGGVVEERVLSGTVASALRQLRVALYPGDVTEPTLDVRVGPGTVIRVSRAYPVYLIADGQERQVLTIGGTVADLLAQVSVQTGPLDRVLPPTDTPLEPDLRVRVVRVEERTVVRQERVAFSTLRWAEPRWERGKTGVLREGQPGVVEYTERVRYEDGELVATARVGQRVVKEPVARIIGIGTRIVWRTLNTPAGTVRYKEAIQMTATAYYPGPESTGASADGITATGMRAGFGVVAVDPRVIPLGTRVYIPGYGVAVAGDVGSAIKGRRIDLCFNTLREALHFGRRTVTVYVLD